MHMKLKKINEDLAQKEVLPEIFEEYLFQRSRSILIVLIFKKYEIIIINHTVKL